MTWKYLKILCLNYITALIHVVFYTLLLNRWIILICCLSVAYLQDLLMAHQKQHTHTDVELLTCLPIGCVMYRNALHKLVKWCNKTLEFKYQFMKNQNVAVFMCGSSHFVQVSSKSSHRLCQVKSRNESLTTKAKSSLKSPILCLCFSWFSAGTVVSMM